MSGLNISIDASSGSSINLTLFQQESEFSLNLENFVSPIPLEVSPTVPGPKGTQGVQGEDGREIQLQVSNGYIQWQYSGNSNWENLISIESLKGEKGDTGEKGTKGDTGSTGPSGENGADGREIEIQLSGGYIQWKYAGSSSWTNLIAVVDLKGETGRGIIPGGTSGQFIQKASDTDYDFQWHTLTKSDVGLGNVLNVNTTTTSNISDSEGKRFVTDSQITVLQNTSGTNSGDETSDTIKTKLGITNLSGSNTGDQDLSGFVQKSTTVNSKELSSNISLTQDDIADGETYKRFSSTEQSKLSGIAAGAEVNVNPDWDASGGDAQILHKPTLGTSAAKDVPSAGNASETQVVLGNDTRLADARTPTAHSHAESDIANLASDLSSKVAANAGITGATKTKITYDSKGLVTSGADATTADISDSSNKRYVTDAQLTVIGNTSGINSGDQTLPTDATISISAVTTNNASTTKHGWAPQATAPSSGLVNVLGIAYGETSYANKALFDSTVPSTQAYGDSASTGSATVAARRDHKHAMPASTKDTTAITGMLKGNGSAISAASAGTDYVSPGGALGTPSSGTLTNCTFPTLNQDTSGTAAKANALSSATTTINVSSATAPTSGQVLTATSSTSATWQNISGSGVSDGDKGDITVSNSGGTWLIDNSSITESKLNFSDSTTANSTTDTHGLLPKLGGGTTNFLRADGTWAAPSGGAGVSDGDKGDVVVSNSGATWKVEGASGTFAFSGETTLAQFTSDQTDLDVGLYSYVRINSNSDNISIFSIAGGTAGRILYLENSGSSDIILRNDDGSTGTAANRFNLRESDFILKPYSIVYIVYDDISDRWILPVEEWELISQRRHPIYSYDYHVAGVATANFPTSLISSGTVAYVNTLSDHPGYMTITSSTSANSGAHSYLFGTQSLKHVEGGEVYECIFSPKVSSNTNTTIRFGFIDTTTSSAPTDGVWFELSPGSLNLIGKTASNSTTSTSSTIYALTVSSWYRCKFIINRSASSVVFYAYDSNGALLNTQTLSANIPTASGREFGVGYIATNSGTTATLLAWLDYQAVQFGAFRPIQR